MATAAATSDMYIPSDPSDRRRWICIYPTYLNARRTLPQGRRIKKDKAVDNPTCIEIQAVCLSIGLNCDVEATKCYCKEWSRDPNSAGRVRVQMKASDGSLINPSMPNKKPLLYYVASMIPKLKTRQTRQGQPMPAVEDTSAIPSQQSKKKKGKKKK